MNQLLFWIGLRSGDFGGTGQAGRNDTLHIRCAQRVRKQHCEAKQRNPEERRTSQGAHGKPQRGLMSNGSSICPDGMNADVLKKTRLIAKILVTLP
jgi:hypothetical protein